MTLGRLGPKAPRYQLTTYPWGESSSCHLSAQEFDGEGHVLQVEGLGSGWGVGSPAGNRPVPAALTPGSLELPPSDVIGQLCALIALQGPCGRGSPSDSESVLLGWALVLFKSFWWEWGVIRTGRERIVVEAGRRFLGVHYAVCVRLTHHLCMAEVLVASWPRPPGPSLWYGDRGGRE